MTEVSGSANLSAQVARQSLAAAGKGTVAVQDSIKGMNEIREQIQETSKRIKRLGESSQEIGEIVELISDITGADQRAGTQCRNSGGIGGRCGTRLYRGCRGSAAAERSGEATNRCGHREDDSDRHAGRGLAMEESTRGVVEGPNSRMLPDRLWLKSAKFRKTWRN